MSAITPRIPTVDNLLARQYRIGRAIRRFRLAAHMTQDDLAVSMNLTRGAVAQWETLRSNPEVSALPMLAAALNTEVTAFFQE